MARGKVITTHLRTGDPNGIRTVFISNKICEMIVFPKSEFDAAAHRHTSHAQGNSTVHSKSNSAPLPRADGRGRVHCIILPDGN